MDISNISNKKEAQLLLGVRIDNFTKKKIFERVAGFLSESKFHQIATVNPEFILEAQKNEKFRNILNSCDLNVADGIGIKFAFWRLGKNLKCRLSGADLMMEILRLASEKNLELFLAARKDGLSTWQETRGAILKICPNLKISGDNIDMNYSSYMIHNTSYMILLCNFGAPYQEAFINSVKNDKIRLAIGVGGAFDFLTGKVRRAPKWMRKMGFEWLWRLIRQKDNRWERGKRILRAIIIFPIKIITNKNI